MIFLGFKDVLKRAANIQEEEKKLEGKFDEPCALCGKAPTEKKWMGQFFHKTCARKARRMAKGMM